MTNMTVPLKSIVERFEALSNPRLTRIRRRLLDHVFVLSVYGGG